MESGPRYDGRRLGQLLDAQGRKRRWLAAQVGISESSISRFISGKQTASEEMARRIVAVLQVPLFAAFDLLDGQENGLPEQSQEAAA